MQELTDKQTRIITELYNGATINGTEHDILSLCTYIMTDANNNMVELIKPIEIYELEKLGLIEIEYGLQTIKSRLIHHNVILSSKPCKNSQIHKQE